MFFLRFLIGGLAVASLPLIADRFGNKIAGYLTVFPVLMFMSFLVLYIARGSGPTIEASKAYLVGMPAVFIASLAILVFVQKGSNIYLAITVGAVSWFLVIALIAKYIY